MTLLQGRAALVTGAANGIGRAIAERLAAEGARVAAVDVEPVPDLGPSVHGLHGDLSRTEELEGLLAEAEAAVGPLDVLVNNAGVFEPALAVDLTLDSYNRVLAVNLHAPVFLASRAARGMIDRGYGRIVNITSVHGRFGEEGRCRTTSRRAGWSRRRGRWPSSSPATGSSSTPSPRASSSTRMSVVDGKDELDSDWFKDVYVKYGKIPIRRYAMPAEIAEHVAWLASERNTYTTGQVLTVDGGLTVTF